MKTQVLQKSILTMVAREKLKSRSHGVPEFFFFRFIEEIMFLITIVTL